MFDFFRDNDEIVAALLAQEEISRLGIHTRKQIVEIWNEYLELIRQERNERIDKLKEKYNEIL